MRICLALKGSGRDSISSEWTALWHFAPPVFFTDLCQPGNIICNHIHLTITQCYATFPPYRECETTRKILSSFSLFTNYSTTNLRTPNTVDSP